MMWLFTECGGGNTASTNPLLAGRPAVGAELTGDCNLVTRRCTRCHTVERILVAHVRTVEHWQRYVGRMRLMPGSGIDDGDIDPILRCLVFYSFGNEGLEQLSNLREQGANP